MMLKHPFTTILTGWAAEIFAWIQRLLVDDIIDTRPNIIVTDKLMMPQILKLQKQGAIN
jgi:hypothetical protein